MLSDFATYKRYIALKQHFAGGTYDFHKYGGKIGGNEGSFMKRSDKYQFHKLAKKYTDEQMTPFMVANFIAEKVTWIGDLLTSDAEERYGKFLSKQQSMSHHFKQDMDFLLSKWSFKGLFERTDSYPPILMSYIENDISIETLIVLNRLTPFFVDFDAMYGEDDYIWSKVRIKCQKLGPFLQYDLAACKKVLRTALEAA